MSIIFGDLEIKGSAVMAEDEVTLKIGGAVDRAVKMIFGRLDANDTYQIVSEAAGDTTQDITVTGRDASGVEISEVISLNGTTVVSGSTTFAKMLKAVKSATCSGIVALMRATPIHSGTALAAGVDANGNIYIDLAVTASAVDNAYRGDLVWLPTGTGALQAREIIAYDGTLQRAYVRAWGITPDATTTYEVSNGAVFELAPDEIMEVRRPFYSVSADIPGGSSRTFYEKVFAHNLNQVDALTAAVIAEVAGGVAASVAFDLETTLSGVTTNGAENNRQIAPATFTFDSAAKNVSNSQNFTPDEVQGIWLELTLAAGAPISDDVYGINLTGTSA